MYIYIYIDYIAIYVHERSRVTLGQEPASQIGAHGGLLRLASFPRDNVVIRCVIRLLDSPVLICE